MPTEPASKTTLPPVGPVIAAAKEAGAAILQLLTEEIHVDNKSDASPVTAADKKADSIVKQRLKAFSDIPILSEEDTPEERAAAEGSRVKWIIDPLDGTKTAIDYAHGHKTYVQFGVHIGLVQDGVPVLGVAFFPAMEDGKGVVYYTGDDGKAYKQTGEDAPEQIRVTTPPLGPEGLRAAVHFYESRRPETLGGQAYTAVPGVGGQRLCMVADGQVDIANMNDIPTSIGDDPNKQWLDKGWAYKQWDLSAAHAILKAAGGDLVSAKTKKSVTYDSPDFKMPGAYAGSPATLMLLGLAEAQPAPSILPPVPIDRGPKPA